MTIDKVIEYAKKNGYDTAQYLNSWRGYDVYEPIFDGEGTVFIGPPLVILVKDNKIRMSTVDEAYQHLDETE